MRVENVAKAQKLASPDLPNTKLSIQHFLSFEARIQIYMTNAENATRVILLGWAEWDTSGVNYFRARVRNRNIWMRHMAKI